MTQGLDGRGAIVTGAGSGIGREIARRLHAAGAAVTLLDINAAAVHDLAGSLGPRALAQVADVTDEAQVEAAVAAAALFLASDDSAWIAGDLLLVDGGGHTKRYPELARRFAGQDC
jgi:NAD(P)-dependent dehydrogenase (short-subunit alcohol dehydrogenase family)